MTDRAETWQGATTEADSRRTVAADAQLQLPGLTLLYHPDLSRVGERALLTELVAGRPATLSRLEPAFAAARAEGEPRALEHRRLSRSPITIEPAATGLVLQRHDSRTEVLVDGQALHDERCVSLAELERGCVLCLGGRVVLMLHRLDPLSEAAPPRFALIGESAAMVSLRQQLRQAAQGNTPVILRGETGTGKELAAHAIHSASQRQGPLVVVNTAALTPSLAAAELFGAARGSFTGAERKRDGYFTRADRGTLFLDEIGEIPSEVQPMLLRCLENGEIQPVGEAPRRVDVRLITATDADLEAAVAAGTFRAPLLYRLAGFEIRLPPLRERREDIGRLLVAFLREELLAIGCESRLEADPPWLPATLVERMARLSWPGNVRQLRSLVRQLVASQHRHEQVRVDATLEALLQAADRAPTGEQKTQPAEPVARAEAADSMLPAVPRRPADISEDELVAALRMSRWQPYAAARRLGISRPSIYHLIRRSPSVRSAADLEPSEIECSRQQCHGDVRAMADALQVSERALRRRIRQLAGDS